MNFDRVTAEFEKEFPDRGWLIRRQHADGPEAFYCSSSPYGYIAIVPKGDNTMIAKGVGETPVAAFMAMRKAARAIGTNPCAEVQARMMPRH